MASQRRGAKMTRRVVGHVVAMSAVLAAIALVNPAGARAETDPALEPPFGGSPVPELVPPESRNTPPPDFELSAREAILIAIGTEAVQLELLESPAMRPRPFTRGADRWQVSYFDDGVEVAQVLQPVGSKLCLSQDQVVVAIPLAEQLVKGLLVKARMLGKHRIFQVRGGCLEAGEYCEEPDRLHSIALGGAALPRG